MRAKDLANKLNAALDSGAKGIEELTAMITASNVAAIDHMNAFRAEGQVFISVLSLLNMAVDEGEMLYMTTETGKLRFSSLEVLRSGKQVETFDNTQV